MESEIIKKIDEPMDVDKLRSSMLIRLGVTLGEIEYHGLTKEFSYEVDAMISLVQLLNSDEGKKLSVEVVVRFAMQLAILKGTIYKNKKMSSIDKKTLSKNKGDS